MHNLVNVAIWIVILLPISLASPDGDISFNYLYVLLIPILVGFKFKSNHQAILYFSYLTLSGIIGGIVNVAVIGLGVDQIGRQYLSLGIAMFPVIFMFCNLEGYYKSFKIAVIFCSVFYSLVILINFFLLLASSGLDPYAMKAALAERVRDWPQRYVLVLFAGLFFTFDNDEHSKFGFGLLRIIVFLTILFTFLRAAYLALFFSFVMYFLSTNANKRFSSINYLSDNRKTTVGYTIYILIFIVFAVIYIESDIFDALSNVLDYLGSTFLNLQSGDYDDNISDSIRIDIFSKITNILIYSPLAGFGGAGVNLIVPEYGSAHNQYFDILVRFGFFGLSFFLYFNYRILRYFWFKEPWVVAIVSAYMIFGLAHETTKYSYGGVIFFLLLSLTYQRQIDLRTK